MKFISKLHKINLRLSSRSINQSQHDHNLISDKFLYALNISSDSINFFFAESFLTDFAQVLIYKEKYKQKFLINLFNKFSSHQHYSLASLSGERKMNKN